MPKPVSQRSRTLALRLATSLLAGLMVSALTDLLVPVLPGAQAKFSSSSLSLSGLRFSRDGRKLAFGLYLGELDAKTGDTDSEIQVFDTTSGRKLANLIHFDSTVDVPPGSIDFSPDGSKLAATWYVDEYVSGPRGGTDIWDLATGKKLDINRDCKSPYESVEFLDDRHLLFGSLYLQGSFAQSATNSICDLQTGSVIARFDNISALYAIPELNLFLGQGYHAEYNGDHLVFDYFVQLFDSHSYKAIANFPQLKDIDSIEAGQGIAKVLTQEPKPRLALLDLKQRKIIGYQSYREPQQDNDTDLNRLKDGRQLKITSRPGQENSLMELVDKTTGHALTSRSVPAQIHRSSLSPDETQVATISCIEQPDTRCELGIWSLPNLKLLRSWPIELDPEVRIRQLHAGSEDSSERS